LALRATISRCPSASTPVSPPSGKSESDPTRTSPDSRFIGLFDPSLVDAHLDALVAQQCDDGGWPISWDALSVPAEYDCRGVETLRALRTLQAFGRLG
jgi:hypothetical protein